MKKGSVPNLKPMISRFRQRINHFGAQPYGVLWGNGDLQLLRFDCLLSILNEKDKEGGLNIADFGCGYGALFTFIQDADWMADSVYTGYDITPEMVDTASNSIEDQRARFVHGGEVSEPADFVLVSGTFSLKCANEYDDWGRFVQQSLLQLWTKSRRGLAFNLLSDSQPEKDPELYYANAADYRKFCLREMSQDLRLIEDPAIHEFTLLVRRETG